MATIQAAPEKIERVRMMIDSLGKDVDMFGTKKEIKYLPEILKDDEIILYLTSGMEGGNTWLITCTDKRIIFLDKGMLYGLKHKEIPLDKINSIESQTGMLLGSIGIWDGASKMDIKNVAKQTVKPFVDKANQAIEAFKAEKESSTVSPDVASEIRKFAALRDEGILSDEEFQAKKRQLLGL
jgi:hypothetical protein